MHFQVETYTLLLNMITSTTPSMAPMNFACTPTRSRGAPGPAATTGRSAPMHTEEKRRLAGTPGRCRMWQSPALGSETGSATEVTHANTHMGFSSIGCTLHAIVHVHVMRGVIANVRFVSLLTPLISYGPRRNMRVLLCTGRG